MPSSSRRAKIVATLSAVGKSDTANEKASPAAITTGSALSSTTKPSSPWSTKATLRTATLSRPVFSRRSWRVAPGPSLTTPKSRGLGVISSLPGPPSARRGTTRRGVAGSLLSITSWAAKTSTISGSSRTITSTASPAATRVGGGRRLKPASSGMIVSDRSSRMPTPRLPIWMVCSLVAPTRTSPRSSVAGDTAISGSCTASGSSHSQPTTATVSNHKQASGRKADATFTPPVCLSGAGLSQCRLSSYCGDLSSFFRPFRRFSWRRPISANSRSTSPKRCSRRFRTRQTVRIAASPGSSSRPGASRAATSRSSPRSTTSSMATATVTMSAAATMPMPPARTAPKARTTTSARSQQDKRPPRGGRFSFWGRPFRGQVTRSRRQGKFASPEKISLPLMPRASKAASMR